MRLPTPLLRRRPDVHKNTFGHALILAGSASMLGAAALTGLAAIRSGAGLVTIGIPKSLNNILQKKINNVIMTWPLPETSKHTLSFRAYQELIRRQTQYNAIAIGPGLTTNKNTVKFILKIIQETVPPLVIDADGLNALAGHLNILLKAKGPRVLTPHPEELSRLLKIKKEAIEKNRGDIAKKFAQKYKCILVLKGHRTVVANTMGQIYINRTGNAGMATAGSGDVLTGMITAFLAQGLSPFEAAKFGVYLHGKAGDISAQKKTKLSMIASDIIDCIPKAIKAT